MIKYEDFTSYKDLKERIRSRNNIKVINIETFHELGKFRVWYICD